MEILAPAGNREALERAQAAGADAVYLGYAAFSARAGAGNFDDEALAEALSFAHLHRMRVYVTVNTLVKDGELPGVLALLEKLAALWADGVLVQDLGILRLAREHFPSLRLHASTQMAIHNATGVRWCEKAGMKRAVLARECSLEEIRKCAETGMEIEVFAHGAQCVAVSGECLFSSMVGERSGNRGRCAQPCRRQYRYDGREGAWLSPRDLCLRDRLPELRESGATSLKIEGRLKRPEYVYITADSYRRGLDSLERGRFRPADAREQEALLQIFNRGGFMTGYAFGAEDAGVIFPESVNHQGVPLGEVESVREDLARVRLSRDLHDGDGLRIRRGRTEGEMTYAGKEVPVGGTAVIRLRQGLAAKPGDPVFRLTDALQLKEAMAAEARTVAVDMRLEAWPGAPLRLILSDGETETEIVAEPAEAARSRATSAEEMSRQLVKTGGTGFAARRIDVETEGAFVPVSTLNRLRREGLEKLAAARREAFERELAGAEPAEAGHEREYTSDRENGTESAALLKPMKAFAESAERTEKTGNAESAEAMVAEVRPEQIYDCKEQETALPNPVTVRTLEQAEACRRENVWIILYPEDFRPEALESLITKTRPGDWLRLPEVCEEETLRGLLRFTEKHRDRLGGVVLGSIGQLGLRWPVPFAAGPGVPVMNREAAELLREEGCAFAWASPELSGEELRALLKASPLPLAAPVYGRTQLMLLHHCPARTALGLREGHRDCRMCDLGDPRGLAGHALTDERGYRFPLQRVRLPEGCLIRLLNTLPTDLGDKGIAGLRAAEMTAETPEEAKRILDALLRNERTGEEATRGHWNRPVL